MRDLDILRKLIDQIDQKLIDLIAERLIIVQQIGEEKKKIGKETVDPVRKNVVLEKWMDRGKEKGLSPEFIKQMYATIHAYAVEIQKKNRE